MRIRAIHPDIDERAVDVDFFWGAELVGSVSLTTSDWLEAAFRLPVDAEEAGVLSLRVSHTWSPLRAGVSQDVREPGVAFAGVSWR